jgi:glycosyltransferase involved in cell wall biosynthesis
VSVTNTYPLVSVIMPTYNRAGYIMETIDSITRQTYPYWELIIVDDGSDDHTWELMNSIKDKRVQFYKAGRIGIGGKIKNIGLGKAKGELLAFIDSDDCWGPQKLEKQVAALAQYPEAGFCLTGGYNFKIKNVPAGHFYPGKEGMRYGQLFQPIFSSEVAVFTQALLLRKECLSIVARFLEEKSFSDFDFIARLAYHFKGIILYEALVYRRLHETNYIATTWEKSYHEGIALIHQYKKMNWLPVAKAKQALFRTYINFGESCLLRKQRAKATRCFYKAWLLRPASSIPFKKTAKAFVSFISPLRG